MSDSMLIEGWNHFEPDLRRLSTVETMQSLRQAYKNGAAMILARLMVRGPEAITPLFDDVRAMQMLRPFAEYVRETVHPEWTELHLDCVFAGGWTMLMKMQLGDPDELDGFKKEVDSFRVE
jgi:hypothetical protein